MKNINNNTLKIVSLNHWYGHGEMRRHVLQSVSMEISPGEVVLLTGPSGCGLMGNLMESWRSAPDSQKSQETQTGV